MRAFSGSRNPIILFSLSVSALLLSGCETLMSPPIDDGPAGVACEKLGGKMRNHNEGQRTYRICYFKKDKTYCAKNIVEIGYCKPGKWPLKK